MTHHTPSSNRRNLRTLMASLLAYVLLTSQLAPMAMAFNRSANRRAPAGRPDIERKKTSGAATRGRVDGSFAPVPVPLTVTAAGMAPIISATKVDSFPDPDMDGKVSPGQNITYTVTLTNTGPDPAMNLTLNDTVDSNTTLIPGSAVATPIGFNDAYNVIGNVRIQPNAAQGLLANDINPNTGNNTGLTASGGTTSTQGGNVAINPDGSFSYDPPVGFTGTDTFTYTATSANGTDVRTVTLTVAGMIFFVNDDDPVAGGDGRLTNPFNCLVGAGCFSASTADEAGDNIFLFNGAYTGGLTFLANQKLIGQGATDTLANIAGVGAVQPYSDPLPVTNGNPANVTITTAATNALTVSAGGITLRGFTVGNTTGAKIFGTAFGTLTAGNNVSPDLILNGTGQALNLTNGTFAATSAFTSVTTTSSGAQGIALTTVAGTVAFGSTTVSGSTTQGILVTTSTANVNFGNTTVGTGTAGSGGTDAISLQNNSAGVRTFGSITIQNNTGIGFLHAVGGGATTITGATAITNPGGAGINIANSTSAITFANVSVTQSGGTGVVMASNSGGVTFSDLDISPDSGQRAFHATSSTGTITTASGDITATGNVTLEITGASAAARTPLAMVLNNLDSINSSGIGVELNFVSGNFTVNDATLATNISNPTGIGIRVQNTAAAGTMNFGNTNVSGSGGTGVVLGTTSNGNAGAITFADLDISSDNAQRGLFSQQSTGTITATSGTIVTTNPVAGSNAIAIEIVGTSAASRTPINLTFNSVSANNALNGIVLTNTSDGGNAFRTLGTGSTDGSGGTIQNITNRGASFISADDIILNNMTFTNVGTVNGADPTNASGSCGGLQSGTNVDCNAGIHANGVTGLTLTNVDLTTGAQQGINGNNVTNFVFSNSNVSAFGNEVNEVGVRFNNMLGASSMSSVHVFNNFSFQVEIQNESGTLSSFPVTSSEFNHSGTASTNGVDGMLFSAQGTAVMNTNITTCNFHDTGSGGFFSDSKGTATMDIVIQTSTFERFGSVPITIAKAEGSNVNFDILNNATIRDAGRAASGVGHGININKASPSTNGTTLQGTISGNTIGESVDTADTDDKGSGIRIIGISQGALIVTVNNNNIQDFRERGIYAQMSEDTSGNNSMSVNITNNTVNNPEVVSEHGILVIGGSLVNDSGTLCANVTGNNSTSSADGIRLRATQLTTVRLPGYAGTPNDTAQLTAFVDANNPATTDTVSAARLGSAMMIGGAACSTPSAPEILSAEPGDMGSPEAPVAQVTEASSTDSITSRPFISSPRQQPAVTGGTAAAQVVVRSKPAPAAAPGPVGPPDTIGEKPSPLPPVYTGNNLTWNVGTLPAGQSVTITFQVSVNNFPPVFAQVSNQGTVTADGGINVLTDDPDVAGANNPTVTGVTLPPDVFIRDAKVAEPTSGTTSMFFSVALSTPATQMTTINYSTVDGSAVAPGDYVAVASSSITFMPGEQLKTIPITVNSDADNSEVDENFTVNITANPAVANVVDGSATGTITVANPAGTVLISELRTSGPNGPTDEFVEIYNNTGTPHTVPAGGYGLFKIGADCNALPVLIGTIPATTVIPARGHYLFVGSAYSLANYGGAGSAAGNQTLTSEIEIDRNVALFSTVDPLQISTANRLDAVGFGLNSGGVCDLLLEGTTLPPASGSTLEYSFVRKFTLNTKIPTATDVNDNAADFTVVSTTLSTPVGSNVPRLGAPGPENLASPNLKNFTQVLPALLDPMVSESVPPNRVRDTTPDPPNNSTFGTIAIRRTFTNNTGAPITRLRFRIYDITTAPQPPPPPPPPVTADLRARTSGTVTVTVTGGGMVTVQGTTLETPPAQPNGGGLNSSLAAGTVTPGTPIANGASINLNFLFGVQQNGSFRVFVFVEALP